MEGEAEEGAEGAVDGGEAPGNAEEEAAPGNAGREGGTAAAEGGVAGAAEGGGAAPSCACGHWMAEEDRPKFGEWDVGSSSESSSDEPGEDENENENYQNGKMSAAAMGNDEDDIVPRKEKR